LESGQFFAVLLRAGEQLYVLHDSEDDYYALASRGKEAVRNVITGPEVGRDLLSVALFRTTFDPHIVETSLAQLRAIVGWPFTIESLCYGATEIRAVKCGDHAAARRLWDAGEIP